MDSFEIQRSTASVSPSPHFLLIGIPAVIYSDLGITRNYKKILNETQPFFIEIPLLIFPILL